MISLPFERAGFLSIEAVDGEAGVDSHHPEAVGYLIYANDVAMRFLKCINGDIIDENERRIIVSALLIIVVRRFQAAVILMRRLLLPEADGLGRTALEATFLLGAFLIDPEWTLEMIKLDRVASSRKGMGDMLSAKEALSLDSEQIEKLQKGLAGLTDKGGSIIWKIVADKADMGTLYATLYKSASITAVHVSERVMAHHVTVEGDEVSINFTSDAVSFSSVTRNALHVLYVALTILGASFKIDSFASEIMQIGAYVSLPIDGE